MKKLMPLMLGLSLALGSVAVVFAQDAPRRTSKKKTGKRPGKRKTTADPKKSAL